MTSMSAPWCVGLRLLWGQTSSGRCLCCADRFALETAGPLQQRCLEYFSPYRSASCRWCGPYTLLTVRSLWSVRGAPLIYPSALLRRLVLRHFRIMTRSTWLSQFSKEPNGAMVPLLRWMQGNMAAHLLAPRGRSGATTPAAECRNVARYGTRSVVSRGDGRQGTLVTSTSAG